MEKIGIVKYFKDELARRKGSLNLSENEILDIYTARCFNVDLLGYEESLLTISENYKDIETNLLDAVSANKKDKKKIKKVFIKAVNEELLELINYDDCNINLKEFIERIPAKYLNEAIDDISSEYCPTLTTIYVIADKICRDNKGKKYSRESIKRYILNSYKNYLELYEDYNLVQPQEENKMPKGKKLKQSYEPYYSSNEIEDYGDNTEYPTDVMSSVRKLK